MYVYVGVATLWSFQVMLSVAFNPVRTRKTKDYAQKLINEPYN